MILLGNLKNKVQNLYNSVYFCRVRKEPGVYRDKLDQMEI